MVNECWSAGRSVWKFWYNRRNHIHVIAWIFYSVGLLQIVQFKSQNPTAYLLDSGIVLPDHLFSGNRYFTNFELINKVCVLHLVAL